MAKAEQIKSLIESHFNDDKERFYSIALQVAAHEAMRGHTSLAHDIREIVDKDRKRNRPKIISFPKDLQNLVNTEEPTTSKSAMVILSDLKDRLDRVRLAGGRSQRSLRRGVSRVVALRTAVDQLSQYSQQSSATRQCDRRTLRRNRESKSKIQSRRSLRQSADLLADGVGPVSR